MKTIVITGATSGIGNLLVKEFVQKGYLVFAGYRNRNLKKRLEMFSENIIPFYIDLSKKWTIENAVHFILDRTEKIDTLINAAGCVIAGPMECLNVDRIREQFEVNTFAHLSLTQGLFEKLCLNGGGKIINISSTSSFGVYPFIAPYCASKRALDMLFNSMEIECGGDVKVISVKPGVIKTPLWEKSIELNKDVLGDNEKYQKELAFMIETAQKGAQSGLDAQKVVDLVVKIEGLEKPKPSYVIGFDAKVAEVVSHLPQKWINFIVRKMLEKRCIF
ncbi:MAG: SDR family NAD(P)-dependent oxidoreductase [Candidatus Gastranaerophilales bacterium]|nr:SDR family NAD(P)-dependent oxidoreductase [Candidatus Gastranaerophilales bacterium]